MAEKIQAIYTLENDQGNGKWKFDDGNVV